MHFTKLGFLAMNIIWLIGLFACEKDQPLRELEGMNFDCMDPLSDDYILPFPVGTSYVLSQGTCSSFDHMTNQRYAFDFSMPIGSIITAARSGSVHAVEEGFSDGDREINHANFVIIEHENGTFGRYLRLTQDGALVELGTIVNRGDTIALSGNSGFGSAPHLHFDVTKCGTCGDVQTTAVGFFNAEPPVENENTTYLAVPY